jgi:hypothetical protein
MTLTFAFRLLEKPSVTECLHPKGTPCLFCEETIAIVWALRNASPRGIRSFIQVPIEASMA